MDDVVTVTEATARRARLEMMEAVATIVGAPIVALSGLAISQYRVIQPLAAMRRAMERLSHKGLEAANPGLERRDEIGAMAASVEMFKDSLVRTRQLGEETALARASAEEQRRQECARWPTPLRRRSAASSGRSHPRRPDCRPWSSR